VSNKDVQGVHNGDIAPKYNPIKQGNGPLSTHTMTVHSKQQPKGFSAIMPNGYRSSLSANTDLYIFSFAVHSSVFGPWFVALINKWSIAGS
jgi:hypothetical protein